MWAGAELGRGEEGISGVHPRAVSRLREERTWGRYSGLTRVERETVSVVGWECAYFWARES